MKKSVFGLALASLLMMNGCATSMKMGELPLSGDSIRLGSVQIHVVDLEASSAAVLKPVVAPIPHELLLPSKQTYKIGPSDVLIVTVWEHPELTQPLGQYRNDLASGQLVDADGTMFFPYAGRIKVAGLTSTQIQKMLTEALAKSLRDPQVDIKVAAYRSQRVFVSGEVRQPGVFPIDDVPLTLPELLNRAGGILPSGDASAVRLVRDGKTFELDYEGLVQAGARLDSIQILSGDQIRVLSSDDRVAYLLGEVARPSLLRLTNGRMSLIRGLTEGGGFTDLSSNAAGVYVVRPDNATQVTVYRLDGRSPLALAWAGQFLLRPRDLVYVDQSGLSRWNRVFQMLVPMAAVLSGTTGSAVNVQTLKTQPW